jgi:DedD protein
MMDRALKERIIGAAVLVLVVVLVVPVFLDGPPGADEIISERVPLPGQSEQKFQTVVLERDRKDPVPSNSGNATPEPTSAPRQTAQPQTITPKPVEEQAAPKPRPEPPPPESASTTGMWAVQLGSFGNQENAERLAAGLRKQGFAAFLSRTSTGSTQLYRVRIGPQKDRKSAEAMAAKLKKAGHDGQVVPHP